MKNKELLYFMEKIPFSYIGALLIFIIIGGMISIIVLSQISVYTLKNDFDVLFEKRTKPIIELEAIKDTYQVNIRDTINLVQKNKITVTQSHEMVKLAEYLIDKSWKHYIEITQDDRYETSFLGTFIKKIFFIGKENRQSILKKSIIDNIDAKKLKINQTIKEIYRHFKAHNDVKANEMINVLYLEINTISIYLTNISNYDLNVAVSERRDTQKVFDILSMILNILILVVFLFSINLSIFIIKHFKNLHVRLEDLVASKTKELKNLNESLEKRISREVSNSRKKDLIMFQQSRLASMGEMIANIAHQWRQPLGSLMMIVQGLQTKMELGKLTPDVMEDKVKDALLLADNMSNTLENFQEYFNPNKTPEYFSLKDCIEHALFLSKYVLEEEKISIEFKIRDEIQIYGYNNELLQVFLNIIANAKDALSEKKTQRYIEISVKESRKNIRINVVDNGGGIEDDVLPHIFEPYYTTKYKSEGTGIGLYMSKQIIENHMLGTINCKNIYYKINNKQFEKCTLFTITIPIHKDVDDA